MLSRPSQAVECLLARFDQFRCAGLHLVFQLDGVVSQLLLVRLYPQRIANSYSQFTRPYRLGQKVHGTKIVGSQPGWLVCSCSQDQHRNHSCQRFLMHVLQQRQAAHRRCHHVDQHHIRSLVIERVDGSCRVVCRPKSMVAISSQMNPDRLDHFGIVGGDQDAGRRQGTRVWLGQMDQAHMVAFRLEWEQQRESLHGAAVQGTVHQTRRLRRVRANKGHSRSCVDSRAYIAARKRGGSLDGVLPKQA